MRKIKSALSHPVVLLALIATVGLLLRLLHLDDMEFKEDEHYNFIQTQLIGRSEPWPWFGMPSGVYLPNPGMSIWVFVWLARVFGAEDPLALAQALALFSWAGILFILPFVAILMKGPEQKAAREPWLWAFALAMVNPFAILYQRKLWPEGFLPFLSMLALMGWWRRDRSLGAFIWGLIGAILGQIHMSGFFSAGALFLWTLLFARSSHPHPTRWKHWLAGSVIGALPLAPWIWKLFTSSTGPGPGANAVHTLNEALQLKFWVFWISDPLGFHLGNPLGILRGNSHFAQLSDFIRYPLIAGHPTYLNGLAHLTVLLIGAFVLVQGGIWLFRKFRSEGKSFALEIFSGKSSPTALAQAASLWGFGILLTLTGVNIRRYYMAASFPFEFLWLSRTALLNTRCGRVLLAALWVCELLISAHFIGYVHVNQGAPQGDYGEAYRIVRDRNLKTTGKPWADRPVEYYH